MKKVLLATFILMAVIRTESQAQAGIFDPNDAVVNYNTSTPPAVPPANTIAKWFRTPGNLGWNTDKFKAYYYNDMVFRVRFPNGYNPADNTKKYPVILFFHGGGEVAPTSDNEIQLVNGAERFEGMIDAGQFNAFLVFPQQKVLGWDFSYMSRINNVLDSLNKYCHTDEDRVISMGLSAGGYGAMLYSIAFSQRVSSTIAASPALIDILTQDPATFVHIPFWLSSGGTDANPNPTVTQNFVDNFSSKGGKIRYNFYPTIGHATWEEQWDEPYLLPTWLAAHKANPLIYFNRSKFTAASAITARLGITSNFAQYQWQKDNIDIPGATLNEYLPTQFGSYRVRFKRTLASNWSDWSPIPAVISQDNIAPTVPQNVRSLFAGRSFVNLDWNNSTDNDSVTNYDVYVNGVKKYTTGSSAITADSLLPNTAYVFTVKALDQAGNASEFSSPITVSTTVVTNGLNYRYYEGNFTVLPNFNALTPIKTGVSPNADISKRNAGVENLFAFVWEGYINIKTPGQYTFETNSDDGSKLYFNSFYSPTARALVNNDGSHSAWARSGTVNVPTAGLYPITITYYDQWNSETMEMYWTGPGFGRSLIPDSVFLDSQVNPNDNIPPTAPTNVKVLNTGGSFVDLDWDNATDDIAVTGYDIYVDDVKKYSSATSNVVASGLLPNTSYKFTIKALDKAGNASPFSTPVTATTSAPSSGGLRYKYYEGSFSTLPNFSALNPVKTGTSPNIDLTVRTAGVNDNFALLWEGNINITTPGTYTFETVSDDGSRFYFNTLYSPTATPLVENDGLHAAQTAAGTITIPSAGLYPVTISYFEGGGGESMQLFWTGPGIARQLVPNTAFMEQVTGDVSAPTVPGNLKSFNVANTFVTLDWDNSTDDMNLSGYDIYVNNVKKYTSSESAFTATGLLPNTAYTFTVKAIDQAGNASAFSNAVSVTTTASLSGLQYRYFEGDWDMLPNFNQLTPVKSGLTPNVDIITPRNRADQYALIFEGNIKIPIAGTYTFETISDDGSRVYFNTYYSPIATPLVNNDGVHGPGSVSAPIGIATAGTYPITITYFEKSSGESLQVYWSGPGIPRQLIPNSAFTPPAGQSDAVAPSTPLNVKALYTSKTYVTLDWDNSTDNVGVTGYDIYVNNVKKYTTVESAFTADALAPNTSYNFTVRAVDLAGNASAPSAVVNASTTSTVAGLNYRYYEGSWNTLPNFNTLTPIKTGTTPNTDISIRTPGVNDNFAFVWEGYLNFSFPGTYTFELVSDDGSRLYFNSFYSTTATPVISNDGLHGPTTVTTTVNVPVAGLYPLSVVYFEKDGGETMQLYISGAQVPRQIVPNVAFSDANPGTLVQNNSATIVTTANAMSAASVITDGNKSIKAYPNPASEWLNLDVFVESQRSDVGVDVFDMTGKVVYKNSFKGLPGGNNTLKMNIGNANLNPGVYFVKVNVNGIPSKVIKVVKARK